MRVTLEQQPEKHSGQKIESIRFPIPLEGPKEPKHRYREERTGVYKTIQREQTTATIEQHNERHSTEVE
mgnify:CR=1 FL=1